MADRGRRSLPFRAGLPAALVLRMCVAALAANGSSAETDPGFQAVPTDQTIPRAVLNPMFRRELGKDFDPAAADRLEPAHALLEKYFLARKATDRKAVVAALEATGLSPDALGRICRIREHWPDLPGGLYAVHARDGPHRADYFLGVPAGYDRTRPWPLVVHLADLTPFLADPAPDEARISAICAEMMTRELSLHRDALLLVPVPNPRELYGPSYAGMNSVIQPIRDAADRVNIDPTRVDLVGHSAAAQGVWNLALNYPTYFAAINPQAGSANEDWQRLRLMNLRNVLPVVWHDESDRVLPINFSRVLVNQLRSLRIDVDFDETRGVGHTPTPEIIERDYAKMRARTRDLYPAQVWLQTDRPDVILNRSDWVQVYQELDTGRGQLLFFRRGSGHMTLYLNACGVRAEVHGNEIDAKLDNVDTLRFYLNDSMVDFKAPVRVIINGREKFRGILKPSVDEMLRDQVYLGRGWRWFTAPIDIETVPPPAPLTRPATRPTHTGRILIGPDAGD